MRSPTALIPSESTTPPSFKPLLPNRAGRPCFALLCPGAACSYRTPRNSKAESVNPPGSTDSATRNVTRIVRDAAFLPIGGVDSFSHRVSGLDSGQPAQLRNSVSPIPPVNRWAWIGGAKKGTAPSQDEPDRECGSPQHPSPQNPALHKLSYNPSQREAETYAVTTWSPCKPPDQPARAGYNDRTIPVATVSAAAHSPTVRRKVMALSIAVAPIAKRTAAAAPQGDWVNIANAAAPAELNATPTIIQCWIQRSLALSNAFKGRDSSKGCLYSIRQRTAPTVKVTRPRDQQPTNQRLSVHNAPPDTTWHGRQYCIERR